MRRPDGGAALVSGTARGRGRSAVLPGSAH